MTAMNMWRCSSGTVPVLFGRRSLYYMNLPVLDPYIDGLLLFLVLICMSYDNKHMSLSLLGSCLHHGMLQKHKDCHKQLMPRLS